MSTLNVRLPESLHRAARELANEDGVSLSQFIVSALGEKVAVLRTIEYLRERGQGADENDLAAVLALVPNTEPAEYDRLPNPPKE